MTGKSAGERARRARKRAEKEAIAKTKLDALRARGCCCGTCAHFGFIPLDPRKCCDLRSDFEGYAIASSSGLCTQWKEKALSGEPTP